MPTHGKCPRHQKELIEDVGPNAFTTTDQPQGRNLVSLKCPEQGCRHLSGPACDKCAKKFIVKTFPNPIRDSKTRDPRESFICPECGELRY